MQKHRKFGSSGMAHHELGATHALTKVGRRQSRSQASRRLLFCDNVSWRSALHRRPHLLRYKVGSVRNGGVSQFVSEINLESIETIVVKKQFGAIPWISDFKFDFKLYPAKSRTNCEFIKTSQKSEID